MFKEAAVTILLFILLFFLLRLLLSRKQRAFQIVSFCLILGSLFLNICYNLKNLFPEFVLDETVPLGDCRENLFLYKADSQYPCHILFPILQDRTVLIDSSCGFYDLFLHTFSKDTRTIEISPEDAALVASSSGQFSHESILHLVTLMDYAFPDNHLIAGEPLLYVCTDGLNGADTLVAVIDEHLNLYLMSETDFYEMTQEVAF
ncbi:MAG: hypothetical protein NC409_04445 [Clostridium sp.]|nr:hypothetical protein [Clostridium sp.]